MKGYFDRNMIYIWIFFMILSCKILFLDVFVVKIFLIVKKIFNYFGLILEEKKKEYYVG